MNVREQELWEGEVQEYGGSASPHSGFVSGGQEHTTNVSLE